MTRENLLNDLIEIVKDMTSDWDIAFEDEMTAETRLIDDLEFESIDVVQLIVAIEERFGRRDFPFEDLLMEDGRYVDDVKLGQFVDFLEQHLGTAKAS